MTIHIDDLKLGTRFIHKNRSKSNSNPNPELTDSRILGIDSPNQKIIHNWLIIIDKYSATAFGINSYSSLMKEFNNLIIYKDIDPYIKNNCHWNWIHIDNQQELEYHIHDLI